MHGLINLDFNDVKTVLKDGGVAIMSTGYGEGEGRVKKAIEDALNSPLLNDNDVFNSKEDSAQHRICKLRRKDNPKAWPWTRWMMSTTLWRNSAMTGKWGLAIDPELGNRVKVTVLATGFRTRGCRGREPPPQRNILRKNLAVSQKRGETCWKDRRKRYYGSDGNTTCTSVIHTYSCSARKIWITDVILQVENTPTYKRTRDSGRNP